MTIKLWNRDELRRLAQEGWSSYAIVEQLNLPIAPRQVQRILQEEGIKRPKKLKTRRHVLHTPAA